MISVHRRTMPLAALAFVAGGLLVPAGPAAAAGPTSAEPARVVATVAAAARPVLRQGSRGAVVTQLQRRLAALHYDVGPIDGIFGASTLHGVVAFQKVNNLARDGIVGSRTWAALDRPAVPKPRYRHNGLAVEVSLSKQVVYLTRAGAVVRILDASSGKASTPTPKGTYSVLRRIDGWRHSSLGWLWRPNYFFRGFAVHGSTSVPNAPASHGCVRVTIAAMDRMWSLLHNGMTVHLYA